MINKALYSSKSDEWATPSGTFDELNAEFGFTLDPCSTDDNCKCKKHFTRQDDGLSRDWGARSYSATRHTVTSLVVLLIPARTDTKYFHDFILHRSEVCFLKGRLKFGNSKNSAPFPSMVVVFRGAKTEI